MIIITGAGGFIGSMFAKLLNKRGFFDLVLVDDFTQSQKRQRINELRATATLDRLALLNWLPFIQNQVEFIIHLGARTDTAEQNVTLLNELNLNYSKAIWKACCDYSIPLIYASSAATYGDGSLGFEDDHTLIPRLKPLNPYGESKQQFDQFVLEQSQTPFFWAGFKFFNVYGPQEDHKNRMASVVFHAFQQIQATGQLKLFRSHRPDYQDGCQLRDFVYINDVTEVLFWFMVNRPASGIYNLGSGKARTFLDLAKAVFKTVNKPENITFIDIPHDIRHAYQYFTQANVAKLKATGYPHDFTALEQGIEDYLTQHLIKKP